MENIPRLFLHVYTVLSSCHCPFRQSRAIPRVCEDFDFRRVAETRTLMSKVVRDIYQQVLSERMKWNPSVFANLEEGGIEREAVVWSTPESR